MQYTPFLRSALGLNTVIDPVRLPFDFETGAQYLAEAVNVDIDLSGRISRRKGMRKITDLNNPHSLWSTKDESTAYVISGNNLYQVFIDGTLSLLTGSLTPGATGYFCEIGHDVYFSNGNQIGILKNRINWTTWSQTSYIGPETDRSFVGPSAGTHLFFFKGRVFYAINNFLIYSEPFSYGCFDPARNFLPIPGGSILMVQPLENGFFVSSDKGVYFISGTTPAEFNFSTALNFPAVPGKTAQLTKAEQIVEGVQGDAVLFVAQKLGLCLGLEDGTILTLTDSLIQMPHASFGNAILNKSNNMQYLTFLEV